MKLEKNKKMILPCIESLLVTVGSAYQTRAHQKGREILIMYNPNEYFDKAWKESHFDTLYHTYRVFKELNIAVQLPSGLEWED